MPENKPFFATAAALTHTLANYSETQLISFLADFEAEVYNRALADAAKNIENDDMTGIFVNKIVSMRVKKTQSKFDDPRVF